MLDRARHILKPGGVVYIAVGNSLALRHLLGAPDDQTGIPHIAFLQERAARTLSEMNGSRMGAKIWSLSEYDSLLASAGLESIDTYACFPDEGRIRHMIPISDVNTFLREAGAPCEEPQFDGNGSGAPFDEKLDALYRLLASNGIAHYFCPAYGLIARRPR